MTSGATATSCIFCEIAAGRIPARVVHEEAELVAFHDLNQQAPIHVLLIPRRHLASVAELGSADEALAGRLLVAAGTVARKLGVEESGYRLVTNTGDDGGQTVPHLHFHLLGGRAFTWPPG